MHGSIVKNAPIYAPFSLGTDKSKENIHLPLSK